ncbi:hypothetical protein KP509_22G069600 [Ceratopteris richardii]|uniref:Reverse transcriptase zinc-binding domain-containing protein n=1 Tax=Ceratopteris richardii TaxID=49495 RepID=A0A8T2S9I2_CERRI|nr:hypothetical protein KP509_22G069600 [Ceratopteris richardii]
MEDRHCSFCGAVEDASHLFYECAHAKRFWYPVEKYLHSRNCPKLSREDVMLGCCKNLDLLLWNPWRGHILWSIWLIRNNKVFGNCTKNFLISLPIILRKSIERCIQDISNLEIPYSYVCKELANCNYNSWRSLISKYYSQHIFYMLLTL